MNEKIKGIVFDLGSTLIKIDYKPLLKNLGLDGKYSEQDIYNLLEHPAQKYESGKISTEMFIENAIQALQVDVNFDRFKHAWCSVATEYVNGMDGLIKILHAKFPLYLLSNTNELHFEYILKIFPGLKIFNKYFLSYKTGTMKPEIEIYKYMLENIPFKASEILFVDDKEINIESAARLGIDAVHFSSSHDLINDLKMKNILE